MVQSRQRRSITGVLFIDKPLGMTSHQAVYRVKRAYQAAKAGHTGSLDPNATGMLPICLGGATKFADYLLSAKKTYQVVAQLGQCTTTGDVEGEIIQEIPVTSTMLAQIDTVLTQFHGTISQIPPMYSAIKHQGQPLYRFARRGEILERPAREVTIDSIKRLPVENEHQLALEVICSKGTYIRTLVEDIGKTLGCGAHVLTLRRLQVDSYTPHHMLSMETFSVPRSFQELDQLLLPITELIGYLPLAQIDEEWIIRIQQGVPVPATFVTPTILNKDQEIPNKWQIIATNGQILGLGERVDNYIAPKRMLAPGEIAYGKL